MRNSAFHVNLRSWYIWEIRLFRFILLSESWFNRISLLFEFLCVWFKRFSGKGVSRLDHMRLICNYSFFIKIFVESLNRMLAQSLWILFLIFIVVINLGISIQILLRLHDFKLTFIVFFRCLWSSSSLISLINKPAFRGIWENTVIINTKLLNWSVYNLPFKLNRLGWSISRELRIWLLGIIQRNITLSIGRLLESIIRLAVLHPFLF